MSENNVIGIRGPSAVEILNGIDLTKTSKLLVVYEEDERIMIGYTPMDIKDLVFFIHLANAEALLK